MKLDDSKLLILLASIILGFLIVSQLKFSKGNTDEYLSLQNFQQMSSDSRKLTDEIALLNEKRKQLELKLQDYNSTGQPTDQVIKNLSDELDRYNSFNGFKAVEGPGVTVTISDSAHYVDIPSLTHYDDILYIVWELKNAGAEAVSINNYRLISSSNIQCVGPVIEIDGTYNDKYLKNGIKLAPPYVIRAIGDPDTLLYALKKNDSYYNVLTSDFRNLDVSCRKESVIKVPGYNGNLQFTYLKPAKD